jgi:hypothetical protein
MPVVPFAMPQGHNRMMGHFHFRQAKPPMPVSPLLAQDDVLIRRSKAQTLAKAFCEATMGQRMGSDEKKMLHVLKAVQEEGVRPEFERAVINDARRHGKIYNSASAIVQDELAGNFWERKFKNAPRKEALDYLRYGKNTYRATGWDYRLYGMYRSLADFTAVCKEYPVMSAGVIGAVAVLGGLFPFLGAASGIGIMGWTTLFTAKNEIQAAKEGEVMNKEKAEHYKASGENIAAFLLTASGMHGIKGGTELGVSKWSSAAKLAKQNNASFITRHAKGFQSAVSAVDKKAMPQWAHNAWSKVKGKPPVTASFNGHAPKSENGLIDWANRGLFVVGLFDNVLLPFNAVADKINHKPAEPE